MPCGMAHETTGLVPHFRVACEAGREFMTAPTQNLNHEEHQDHKELKDSKASNPMDDSANTVLEDRHAEIDQQTESQP